MLKMLKEQQKKIELYLNGIHEKNILNLVEILKANNIITKDDLNQCILHYRKKCSNEIKSSFWNNLASILISLASFMIVGYDDNAKTIDYDKLAVVFGSAMGIIATFFIISYCLRVFISTILIPKDKYDELEENLTYIYINFNKYFSGHNIKKRKGFIQCIFDSFR